MPGAIQPLGYNPQQPVGRMLWRPMGYFLSCDHDLRSLLVCPPLSRQLLVGPPRASHHPADRLRRQQATPVATDLALPARHVACGPRLPSRYTAGLDSLHRQPQAFGPLRDGRPAQRGRHPGGAQVHAQARLPARRLYDGYGKDYRGEPCRPARPHPRPRRHLPVRGARALSLDLAAVAHELSPASRTVAILVF
eukprot:scaffold12191_cov126-Isochrysis_galbana.AAC.1